MFYTVDNRCILARNGKPHATSPANNTLELSVHTFFRLPGVPRTSLDGHHRGPSLDFPAVPLISKLLPRRRLGPGACLPFIDRSFRPPFSSPETCGVFLVSPRFSAGTMGPSPSQKPQFPLPLRQVPYAYLLFGGRFRGPTAVSLTPTKPIGLKGLSNSLATSGRYDPQSPWIYCLPSMAAIS